MEEEKEKVFFVKTKKKKAKKKADVIILDDENCNSKEEEVVKCVKNEVIDCEDQIVRMEDKNKVKIRLGKKKNIREIQNCVISKSEVIREQEVKNEKGDLYHKVDAYLESSIRGKVEKEKPERGGRRW